jgi:hypothetical protein
MSPHLRLWLFGLPNRVYFRLIRARQVDVLGQVLPDRI